ncbi:MAG: hypothetical protein ACE5D4_05970 [Thermodesulfobacteriota bacterium]
MYSYIFERGGEVLHGRRGRSTRQRREASPAQALDRERNAELEQLLISLDCKGANWRERLRDGLDEIRMNGNCDSILVSTDSDL